MNTLLDRMTSTGCEVKTGRPGLANILYAEDDPDLRCLSTGGLTRCGYAITPVEDGQAAWNAPCHGNFDLVITENEMPRLSGFALVNKMRMADIQIPVVMACDLGRWIEKKDCERLRLAAVLQKPFVMDDLLWALRQALGSSSQPGKRAFTRGLTGIFSRFHPADHWGINERAADDT